MKYHVVIQGPYGERQAHEVEADYQAEAVYAACTKTLESSPEVSRDELLVVCAHAI